jgi:uncharacterized protein (DUF58 family)
MSAAINFLHNIGKRFYRSIYTGKQQDVNAPLLTREEILDLSYRAEALDREGEHHYEVAHRQYGDARSVYRGFGMDYEESRPYQSGDDFRFMNWRLSARSGELYMKVFREERQPSVFILMDRRASMRFGTQQRLKVTQAARVASLLAFSAQNHNTPVGGVLLEEEQLTWVPEFYHNSGAFTFINAACKACPPLPPTANKETTTENTTHVIRLLHNMLVQGSIVYLIGDFHDINRESQPALLQLACEHRVYAIRILDEAEINLPRAGELDFIDDVTGMHKIDTSNTQTLHAYRDMAKRQRDDQNRVFAAADISCIDIHSDEDAIERHVPVL